MQLLKRGPAAARVVGGSRVLPAAARCRKPIRLYAVAGASTDSSGASTSAPAGLIELQDWVKRQGGRIAGIKVVRESGAGYGLQAAADTPAGTRLIDLPSAAHLTYDQSSDPRLLALVDKVPSELWGAKLALQLLAQRVQGPAGKYAPYVAALPVGVAGLPMFFSREAVAAIEYPPLVAQVNKRCRWLAEFSAQVLAPLPGTPADPFDGTHVDINALGWALACVTSRAFRTRGPQYPAACLPLIDLANHSFTPSAEVLPTDTGVAMVAKRPIKAGEPLQLSYGTLPNDFLLLDYGFVVDDNPHDRVQLRFDLGLLQAGALVANVQDALGGALELSMTPWRRALLQKLGLVEGTTGANLEVTFGGPQHVDPRLLAAARILAAGSEAELQARSLERLGQLDAPLSKANETAALCMLSGVAATALSRFTTSLDQDEAALAAGTMPVPAGSPQQQPVPLTADLRLALRFRAGKKRILSGAIQAMGGRLKTAMGSTSLKQSGAGLGKKGEAPTAATTKGFGARPDKK